MSGGVPIVDAHLDLAWNARRGRDLRLSVSELRAAEQRTTEQAMVTLPELVRAGVAVAFGTLYTGTAKFDDDGNGIYEEPPDVDARKQLEIYGRWQDEGLVRIIRDRAALADHIDRWRDDQTVGIVLLIEGGDSIATPDALEDWWNAGVRIVGPAWSRTRYCGGTRAPGGLTELGRKLLARMKDLGAILDVSHMAEQSVWEALEGDNHRVIASHSNARALVPGCYPTDRHLNDEVIAAIAQADGVIGVVPANTFLVEGWERGTPVPLSALARHLEHIASIAGWERVAIGSDLDGGFGSEESPAELDTVADLVKIGDLVPPHAREGVLGGNWLRILSESLP